MPTLVEIPRPDAADAAPHPLLRALHAAEEEVEQNAYGHTDFVDPPAARVVGLLPSPYTENVTVVALADGADPHDPATDSVLGFCDMTFPQQEDLANVMFHLAVRPSAPDADALRAALFGALTERSEARARSTYLTWVFYAGPIATGPDAVAARSGTGAVDGRRPDSRFLLDHGFELEQTERQSLLRIPADRGAFARRVAAMRDEVHDFAGDTYELLSWSGPTPDDVVDDMAVLRSRMSVDVPSADLSLGEERWDAERVRTADERSRRRGFDVLTAVVRHRPSGSLAGYTQLYWRADAPAAVFQEDTLVHGDHRGHRLGMLIKAANLASLLEVNPDADRVHTWNATENSFMLAINEALGFEMNGVEGAWQRRGVE